MISSIVPENNSEIGKSDLPVDCRFDLRVRLIALREEKQHQAMYKFGHKGKIQFIHGIRSPVVMWIPVEGSVRDHDCLVSPVPE
jgi:hypothetical protein